ncbi:unnamed protein product [Ectocarpus sp. 12 AP-2014]
MRSVHGVSFWLWEDSACRRTSQGWTEKMTTTEIERTNIPNRRNTTLLAHVERDTQLLQKDTYIPRATGIVFPTQHAKTRNFVDDDDHHSNGDEKLLYLGVDLTQKRHVPTCWYCNVLQR